SVTNTGSIDAEAYGNAFGVFASAAAGNASAANGGSVYAYSYGNRATGVLVQAIGGDATVRNTGDVTAVSDYGAAFAIDASAYGGNVVVTSGGTLQAGSYHGTAVGISAYALDGNAEVDNSGSIAAISIYGNAIGISTDVSNGIASAGNGGSITVAAPHGNAIGISGYAAGGDVDLGNIGGNITVVSPDYSAIGLAAYSTAGNVSLNNDGRITATGHTAIGTYGNAASGIVSVDNSGAIGAYSDSGFADGVLAYGAAVDVSNTASIDAEGYNWAAGIEAHGSDAASVTNSGNIVAISTGDGYSSYAAGNIVVVPHSRAYGVYAAGGVGGVSVTNAAGGSIGAYGYDATGIFGFSADGDVSIDNGGAITSVGVSNSHGALALSYQGDADIGNSGDIDASSQSGDAVGLLAVSTGGTATADDSGDVVAQSGRYATGIAVQGYAGAVVTNSGSVSAVGTYVNGVVALTYQGDVSVNNDATGSVSAQSYTGSAAGLVGTSTLGDVTIDNGGNVAAIAYGNATGIYAGSSYGDVSVANIGDVYSSVDTGLGIGISAVAGDGGAASVTNSGGVDAASEYGVAVGIYAAGNGLVSVTNSGTINVDGDSLASGIGALGQALMVDNSGTIHAYGHAASGINVYGLAGAQVVNSGTVDATSTAGGDAVGVHAYAYGNLLVYNTGTITATDDDYAVAVDVDAVHIATVVNAGTLRTTSTTEGQVAVRGGDGVQQIFNYGDIYGAIITGGGDDTFANRSGGVWDVSNHSTDFGDGDDSITNGAGGTIVLANGAIHMGASGAAGNAFTNSGRILVQGSGLIDMGGGAPSSNALPLVNNGLIDFVDGMPDDILTIAGDLAGAGSINVDVSPLNQGADLLYVEGNITGGSVQTVNVNFTDFPALGQVDPIAFAHVSGDSTAGSFVAGQVVGFSANNFLDMQVAITSQLDPTNASDDVFSVGVDVTGLSDPGTLGASVASGAQSLLTSQIGTWRQRMGVLPDANPANVGVSPWIRVFSDKGEVDPTHVADSFGNGGNFDYDQSNSGREIGMNIDFRGGFNAGLLLAKSDGTQHLRGPGVGSDHLSGSAFGLYGTWIGDNGFYVDASYRWFDFTADLRSAAGKQSTEGQGGAFNVEAGFTAWKVAGIDVAPQVQYTRAAIGNIRPIHGDQVDFVSNGGTSSRGRVGVAFSRKIDNAGWIWTPYGSVNAVREFDGKTDYTIADTFTGSTRTDGISAMVELGVGAQKDGLSVTAGANWTDGGALQSFVGGQLVLRYTW
ncbi:MAG TPA: autotransporter outer membrane beta-barrel domain-containing protein, partial [Luteimonas sp.]|nr:autotransporter outer membrane beta-barrel domain-containing protein [Luteimonas sp.]